VHRFSELFEVLSDVAREQSCRDALASAPDAPDAPGALDDLWIFGYGSLMWDAPFPHEEAVPVRLAGWHRAMCVWSALARGTPNCPGLSLGLLPGGTCDGMAIRISKADQGNALPIIWEREMWTDIYQPTWVSLEISGAIQWAITFTTNQDSAQYAGDLSPDQVIEHIAQAIGERGPCRDYLANTVAKLDDLEIVEPYLEDLYEAVSAR
jgi:cation transport protein ChaC